ncbi:hypothetical protein HYY71_02515, partial [Candidatus Woesearchaeota archaeon]|nr:hypothetical protein [Candidatus Woesearchaeota archaeon]
MTSIKKEAIFALFLTLIAVNSINALADELGCCSNTGSGLLACSADRLIYRDAECCPSPETNFPNYYRSEQNVNAPANANECKTSFFFTNRECSSVAACALGCCCSELGGTIKPEAQCSGTGSTFYRGQTNCNSVCQAPECNDNIDNDNNGCADFENGDLGCASPADADESGGSCASQGAGCNNPNYAPKLSNLQITPLKGQRKFLLRWQDECGQTASSYNILRCKNTGCTNFELAGTTNTNSFEDASQELEFDVTYTYQIKARYILQTALPTITKTATLGNIQCLGRMSSDNFCIHELNKAYSCDASNKLVPEGTSCSSNQICIISNNNPSCISKVNCNYNNANPFGLFYTIEGCENGRYCFYDRSASIVNSCFSCNPSMSCYDYKTEESCTRDNCRIGSCRWKNLANQLGTGVCAGTKEYNCQWCTSKGTSSSENLRAFNEVFDFCTKEKSNALSEAAFKCYFRDGTSKNCDQVVCRDYKPEECPAALISHDENNKINSPSSDDCGIKVCQKINNECVKNSDGDSSADCATALCESDYFAPNATLIPIINRGLVDKLIVQIYDKTSSNSSFILKTSSDYSTFLCVEPCGLQGHPYSVSTPSRTMIVSNLNIFDGGNGNRLLTLNEGANIIRYYSQDPAKNIGEVRKAAIEAHSRVDGPKIFSINISGASSQQGKFYTSNQKPTIEIEFFEPAIVTFSRIISRDGTRLASLQASSQTNKKFSFAIEQPLPLGEYIFELHAKNNDNIFMNPPLSQPIVIDNNMPTLSIVPLNGTVINNTQVVISLTFDKEANLDTVKLNSEDIKGLFSTSDNKIFTSTTSLQDGNKQLEVTARDFAGNQVTGSASFIVDANPTTINLISPRFGTSPNFIFDVLVETDNNAECRLSIDNNFEFEFMDRFATTGATSHTITNFNKIALGDTNTHKLNVRCRAQRGFSFASFDISVDPTPPQLKNAFAFPNPIVEKPSATKLTVESNEPVICKYSSASRNFESMEGKFEGFDNGTFKIINKHEIILENEGNFLYFIACKNKAELNSETKDIPFRVDLTIPISIISHTPEFFSSTNAVLAVETNKKSQCKFSETDSTAQNGEIFGGAGYSHTRQMALAPGKHTFYIVCKDQFLQRFSDVAPVTFTIDVTPPIILSVDDSSTLAGNPEFTWSTDTLRVKWNSIENESRISSHLYSVIESGTSRIVLNSTQSLLNNEWVIATKANGTSLGLLNGNRYFFRLKAQNVAGLSSNISESDGITIDTALKPVNCTNGIKDEKETDIDCGSGCDLCVTGKKCAINTDCRTNFCNNGICSAPKCDDNVRNQEESDADCGGPCKKCQDNQVCGNNNDCESGFCSFGFCKP